MGLRRELLRGDGESVGAIHGLREELICPNSVILSGAKDLIGRGTIFLKLLSCIKENGLPKGEMVDLLLGFRVKYSLVFRPVSVWPSGQILFL